MRTIAREVEKGKLAPEEITDQTIDRHLATHYMPDPDLLIRTGGEIRLSNYLLWQCAYTELYFCDTFWPDFKAEELCKAICDFQKENADLAKPVNKFNREQCKIVFTYPADCSLPLFCFGWGTGSRQ